MEAIQQNLQRLQALLKSSDRDRHGEAAQICRDLYSLCLERTSDTELGARGCHDCNMLEVNYLLSALVYHHASFAHLNYWVSFTAFTTSVIFNAENGVLQFLKSSAKLDEVIPPRI